MQKLWDGLTVFLKRPDVQLDNNVAAILYSLIESAKLSSVEPREYLLAATREALEGRDVPLPHEFATAN